MLDVGKNAGSKINKAKELNIEIMEEKAFITMVEKSIKELNEKKSNQFEMTKELKDTLNAFSKEHGLTAKQKNIVKKYIETNAILCYYLEKAPLASSLNGIPYCPVDWNYQQMVEINCHFYYKLILME